MWFGVLGPLLVRDGESVISIPAGQQRALLAALLLRAGTVVPADALAEVMWNGAPPAGAETTLRSHVMRLRRVLGPAAGARVVTRHPGYLVEASDGEVDLSRFRGLYREGGAAVRAGDWARAWDVLTEGLGLWRGEPLADIPSELLRRDHVPELEELRLQAAEWRVDAGLALGRHGELVTELRSLVGRFPLRERFAGQLMLALVRCGRQAEALEAYQRTRAVLVGELGAEPGAELRDLHQQILAGDPALAVPAAATLAGDRPAPVVPRELPAPVAHFAGRSDELDALTRLLDRSGEHHPEAIVISAIGGTAGVGKTALAVQWAHYVAGRFPDGQLYVNLRGYDPDHPMPAADALAGFLRALGVPGPDIPAEGAERATRYRSLLADRRMLIVLDNARSEEQVRPLLPGSPACAVVVTSRDALAGLVARDGAERLELDLLPLPDAVGLLRELIGERVENDPAAAEMLAGRCGRLPLALRVAAELAVARPAVTLANLAGELADQQGRRLDLLDSGGDPRTGVRAVFSWSHQHLDDDTARAFRLLSLHPGPDFEAYAAAALTGTGPEHAGRVLDALIRAHLIQMTGPGRYGMHDLLRAYARELAVGHEGENGQQLALTRLFDHYLHTAAVAMDTFYPAERQRRPRVAPPATPAPPVTDPALAQAWLDAERAALVAVTAHAASRGWPGHATRLAATLFRYLDAGSHYPEAIIIHGHARAAARSAGDLAAEATALNALGGVHRRQGDYQQAAARLEQALALFGQTGDRLGQARTMSNLGNVYYRQGRYQQAAELSRQSVRVFRGIGDRFGEELALEGLGIVRRQQGRYRQAISHHRRALALARELGDPDGQALSLGNLGTAYLRQGRYQEADDSLQQALILFRQVGLRTGEATALIDLGALCLGRRDLPQAVRHLQQALALLRETRQRDVEADALSGLGDVLLAAGQPRRARARHTAALDLASRIGDKYQQARAHDGLGHACQATGNAGEARRHWEQALALYTELGIPEADQVRAKLGAAADDDRAREDSPPEKPPIVRLAR
jgi:tetratricopeptide (TPR) repeat protein/DNA-binding SARP family transcriptional activator